MERAQLYRKGSLGQIQSPEQLNDYLHVTNPSVWVLLTAVILLLVGLLVWGSFAYIDSEAAASGEVVDGVMTLRFEDSSVAESIQTGMQVTIGESTAEIVSLGRDELGFFALAQVDLPDGNYEASVRYSQTQLLKLAFR